MRLSFAALDNIIGCSGQLIALIKDGNVVFISINPIPLLPCEFLNYPQLFQFLQPGLYGCGGHAGLFLQPGGGDDGAFQQRLMHLVQGSRLALLCMQRFCIRLR